MSRQAAAHLLQIPAVMRSMIGPIDAIFAFGSSPAASVAALISALFLSFDSTCGWEENAMSTAEGDNQNGKESQRGAAAQSEKDSEEDQEK